MICYEAEMAAQELVSCLIGGLYAGGEISVARAAATDRFFSLSSGELVT